MEKDGTNIVVAVVHAEPSYSPDTSWPPHCVCCDTRAPARDARVSAALSWIHQVLEKREISIPCSRIWNKKYYNFLLLYFLFYICFLLGNHKCYDYCLNNIINTLKYVNCYIIFGWYKMNNFKLTWLIDISPFFFGIQCSATYIVFLKVKDCHIVSHQEKYNPRLLKPKTFSFKENPKNLRRV